MDFNDYKSRLNSPTGHFICRSIGNENDFKTVKYVHDVTPAVNELVLTRLKDQYVHLPELIQMYSTFGSIRLYSDPESGDSAFFLGSPDEWSELHEYFQPWIADLDEDEEVSLPDWVADSITIGEIPQAGNYLLMPTTGEHAGKVIEFEHDGFEFLKVANSLHNFLELALSPDSDRLTEMASHMRFCVGKDRDVQWWIVSHQDENGNIVETQV